MADPNPAQPQPVLAKSLANAPHNTVSAPLRWLAGLVAELAPWFTLAAAVTGLLTIGVKHLGAFCIEAQAWANTNIESRGPRQAPKRDAESASEAA